MNNNLLKTTLLSNAIFSLISGSLLAIFNVKVSNIMGIGNEMILKFIGFGLIIFCTYLFYTALKANRSKVEVWAIIVQDLLWVVASIILIALNPFGITSIGNILIGGVAAVVLLFAVLQYKSLRD